jgi:hypothetical protein
LAVVVCGPTFAAGKGRNRTTDTTAPSVAISAPSAGSTTGTSLTVTGTASDNIGVSSVSLQVDGGGWQPASGTTSWSVPLAGFTAGSHTVTAKAADAAGNTRTASSTFTVSSTATPPPSPSPTPTEPAPSPSPSPSPTQPAPSPTPSPTGTTSTGTAPNTQGTWTSPEGLLISVSSSQPWTIAQVYRLVLEASAGPGDFNRMAPMLKVRLQDTYSTLTVTSAVGSPGAYSSFQSTIWLDATASGFISSPEMITTHEYGHAWSEMHLYLDHGGSWSGFQATRWSGPNGSPTLANDGRLSSSYAWDTREIVADDYRLLFGTETAISQADGHLNPYIVDPRNQPGLKSWFLSTWK